MSVKFSTYDEATSGKLFFIAVSFGCDPLWWDGVYGWGWHCTCPDNQHGSDQQCSAINIYDALTWAKE